MLTPEWIIAEINAVTVRTERHSYINSMRRFCNGSLRSRARKTERRNGFGITQGHWIGRIRTARKHYPHYDKEKT